MRPDRFSEVKSAFSEEKSLIDALLDEQRQLTAVEKFSRRHDQNQLPLHEKNYRDLIPVGLPKSGEQFAFEVDLDACSGCKACVTACHSLNGLDEHETWRKVGMLVGDTGGAKRNASAYQQTITTACHHCVDPGCLNGCPVEAYEKDSTTGIVRHLDDQCIGCRYCSWMCPYDVPQYSETRGIVRKCDMCYSRLSVGEAPACVQACPNGAITIRIVSKTAKVELAKQNNFLPDAPNPNLTIPSTLYISANPLPSNVKSSSSETLRPEHAHWPLIFMLLLTQTSVGLFALQFLSSIFAPLSENILKTNLFVASGLGLAGLIASVFHLGRPTQAWRCFLGWKHSWLSREVIVFGAYGALIPLSAAAHILPFAYFLIFPLSFFTPLTGALGILCSAMLYHATRRDFWHLRFAGGRFFGTALVLGLAALWLQTTLYISPGSQLFGWLLMAATTVKLGWEISVLKALDLENEILTPLQKSARLLTGKELRPLFGLRLVAGLSGGIFLPILFIAGSSSPAIPVVAVTLCIAGEVIERYLFFAAVAPQKMPGGDLK